MRPESPDLNTKPPPETMMAEQPQRFGCSDKGKSAEDRMSYETHKQQQYYGPSTAEYRSAEYLQEGAETFSAKHTQSDMKYSSQNTVANSTSLDDNLNKRRNSTGFMGIVNGIVDRILPGATTPVRQKNRRSDHQQRTTPIPQEQGPVPKPHEQGSVPWPHKQVEAQNPHNHGEDQKIQEQIKRQADQLREMEFHNRNLENIVRTLREDLHKANTKVSTLGKAVTESEAIITQSHATAVSTLAGNVSRGVTDDMIREELKKFFQNDFFSWCADLCTERIVDENAALHKLHELGIINSSENYLNSPLHLKFTVNTPDGSSPLVLLQAALARRLCSLFLNDAYFLAEELQMKYKGRSRLRQFERYFDQAQPDAAIDWRVQTVECLESSVPITQEYMQQEVQDFVQEYEFLLSTDKYDHEANKDLVQIFTDFATLALKLWKTRANIEWCDMASFGEAYFELGHPWVEVEQSLALTMGQRLNGRPIGFIIRPLIASKSLSKNGKVEEVIWLKALAWVSGENEPVHLEKKV